MKRELTGKQRCKDTGDTDRCKRKVAGRDGSEWPRRLTEGVTRATATTTAESGGGKGGRGALGSIRQMTKITTAAAATSTAGGG